jgi:hypothetical protein
MKKEISFKSFLTDISDWLANKKNTVTEAHNHLQEHDAAKNSEFEHPSKTHQLPCHAKAKYDRYYPLYLQDRDVNSHF